MRVLRYLAGAFRRISILTFREKLFPELSVLILAEGKATFTRGEMRISEPARLVKSCA
jgi:hypothetical protein